MVTFVNNSGTWFAKLGKKELEVSKLIQKFYDYHNFDNSYIYPTFEVPLLKSVTSYIGPSSLFNLWFDYVQARIFTEKTLNYKEENNYSLLNGKHVKQIDKFGETVLKDLQDILKGTYNEAKI